MIGLIIKWKPNTKRPRGQTKQRQLDRIQEDLKLLHVRNAEECAKNKERWSQCAVQRWALKACKSLQKKLKLK